MGKIEIDYDDCDCGRNDQRTRPAVATDGVSAVRLVVIALAVGAVLCGQALLHGFCTMPAEAGLIAQVAGGVVAVAERAATRSWMPLVYWAVAVLVINGLSGVGPLETISVC